MTTISISYSGASSPSAHSLADALNELGHSAALVRDSTTPVDVNWGRAEASATLNGSTATATNKRRMREKFHEAGVPAPLLLWSSTWTDTGFCQSPDSPAIGRPDRHTRGRGFWHVNSEAELARALSGVTYRSGKRKQAATHFMEYISPERAPYEFRVHVFMGKVIRVSRKAFTGNDHGAHRDYRTVSAAGLELRHVRNAAKLAVSALGLDFGAVDILASDSEAWVLEVNTAPGLGGTMPGLYAEKFVQWKESNNG